MDKQKLDEFLERHDLRNTDFADLIGVTGPAVDHWLSGRRPIPHWVEKLCGFFDKHPEMVAKY